MVTFTPEQRRCVNDRRGGSRYSARFSCQTVARKAERIGGDDNDVQHFATGKPAKRRGQARPQRPRRSGDQGTPLIVAVRNGGPSTLGACWVSPQPRPNANRTIAGR